LVALDDIVHAGARAILIGWHESAGQQRHARGAGMDAFDLRTTDVRRENDAATTFSECFSKPDKPR
jgi:hypothetical protein